VEVPEVRSRAVDRRHCEGGSVNTIAGTLITLGSGQWQIQEQASHTDPVISERPQVAGLRCRRAGQPVRTTHTADHSADSKSPSIPSGSEIDLAHLEDTR